MDTMETTVAARKLTLRCQFCGTWNRIDAGRAASKPKCGKCGTPMLLDRPIKLDDDSFTRTIGESEIPVLVDFYTDWCGPCKMMAPFVDELAAKYLGRVLVAKVDADRARQAAAPFNIRGIPTTIVFKDGKPVAQKAGAMALAGLEELLKPALT
jgi:thioredoxin 2